MEEGEEEGGEEVEVEEEAEELAAVEVLARVREDKALHVQRVSGACSTKTLSYRATRDSCTVVVVVGGNKCAMEVPTNL